MRQGVKASSKLPYLGLANCSSVGCTLSVEVHARRGMLVTGAEHLVRSATSATGAGTFVSGSPALLAVAAIAAAGLRDRLRLPPAVLRQGSAALVHLLEPTGASAPCEEIAGLVLHELASTGPTGLGTRLRRALRRLAFRCCHGLSVAVDPDAGSPLFCHGPLAGLPRSKSQAVTAAYVPVSAWGRSTSLDSGESFCRRNIDRTIIEKMARNSLCQF